VSTVERPRETGPGRGDNSQLGTTSPDRFRFGGFKGDGGAITN